MRTLGGQLPLALAVTLALGAGAARAQDLSASYEGAPVRFGQGEAHTVVRTDADGKPVSIGIVFSESALAGLPAGDKDMAPAYQLAMPSSGPQTVVDHVVINWEGHGHPPPGVYDVPHFDFHFYLVSPALRQQVAFGNEGESGDPRQQPPAALLPAGYVVPPGTAVPQMGVHAVNPAAPEFQQQPFTATFIYGYHNQQQTFVEPMVALSFLQSKPSFSAAVARPASYGKAGVYPASYSVTYDAAKLRYEVALQDLR
ncbi:DUF5602 domain-containing protein [Vogesella facilis]|uniref:DUF5602 domain-containing protein n=1 Tax=Vogesella facilis TaxID=1655232 RepID=A0ABV7RBU9_9NEIS